jgi:phenylalanyl-tRNA synthetase alpha chain
VTLSIASPDVISRSLAVRDLADPALGPHAIQIIVDSLVETLSQTWQCHTIVHRGSPIVSIHDNYERLRYPVDAITRDIRYSRYISESTMLRSHTTAMIPGLLDRLASERPAEDVLLAAVGLAYRRDAIDRLHVGEPHQMDAWRIRRGRLDDAELQKMIAVITAVLAPGAPYETRAAVHPYTIDGREIYVQRGGQWVEIGECGLAHPEVLRDAGLDPNEWSGLAMGIGLDRAVMLRKQLEDMRLLRSEDPRVKAQMNDLSVYRPVSSMPPVRRDMSIATAPGMDAETIGDRVREALGERAVAVEDLAVISETPMERPRQISPRAASSATRRRVTRAPSVWASSVAMGRTDSLSDDQSSGTST